MRPRLYQPPQLGSNRFYFSQDVSYKNHSDRFAAYLCLPDNFIDKRLLKITLEDIYRDVIDPKTDFLATEAQLTDKTMFCWVSAL